MITQLRVRDLGVIGDIEVDLGGGMTVITGETGAGKTLIVDALELLVGARSDPSMVRAGAVETVIEAQCFLGDEEYIVRRHVPAAGRSRAMLNGTLLPLSSLTEFGERLLDLYGQHAHQSLLRATEQRSALDRFAGVDLEPLRRLRYGLREVDEEFERLGGDDQLHARELDLLHYELDEIERLAITSGEEDVYLEQEHDVLQGATALREAVSKAHEFLVSESGSGAADLLGEAWQALTPHEPLGHFATRLEALCAEVDDLAHELERSGSRFEEDPERLAQIRERRSALVRLIRKHGQSLSDVLAAQETLRSRIDDLAGSTLRRQALMDRKALLAADLAREEEAVGSQRRRGAPPLAKRVEDDLHRLGLGSATLQIQLPAEGLADEVVILFAANRGEAMLPLAKVASGGELARAMLALRLVLSAGPPTLIFDEVDAGIGGEAAIAIGRSLQQLASTHQVIVVTHLAQVAAFADRQLVVDKREEGGRTLATISAVEGDERITELARMLSGHPDSEVAKRHAAEMLAEVHGTSSVER